MFLIGGEGGVGGTLPVSWKMPTFCLPHILSLEISSIGRTCGCSLRKWYFGFLLRMKMRADKIVSSSIVRSLVIGQKMPLYFTVFKISLLRNMKYVEEIHCTFDRILGIRFAAIFILYVFIVSVFIKKLQVIISIRFFFYKNALLILGVSVFIFRKN